MDIFLLSTIGSYTIGIAAVTGLVRYNDILLSYRPFVVLCVVGFINEIVTTITAHVFHNNAYNLNVYVLLESFIYMRLFFNWGAFRANETYYVFTLSFLLGLWIVDNFILNTIHTINSLFRIVYSFTLIFLAINQLNKVLLTGRDLLIRDSRFLICTGILIFYSYKATIETFYLLTLSFSDVFYNRIHTVLEIVNVFVNLIFALSVLWIPRRQKFILPF